MKLASQQDMLVRQFLPMTWRVARRFSRDPQELEDIQASALEGLVEAINRYEPDRGTSFATYAWRHMQWAISRNFDRVQLVSRKHRFKLKKEGKELPHPTSIETIPNFANRVSDATAVSALDDVISVDERKKLRAVVDTLPARKRTVLIRRFFAGETFDTIALDLGVTRQRVHQITLEAIALVRDVLVRKA